jgi:hypothetical protein
MQAVKDVGGHTEVSESPLYPEVHISTVDESLSTAVSVVTVATCAAVAPPGVDQVRCSAQTDVGRGARQSGRPRPRPCASTDYAGCWQLAENAVLAGRQGAWRMSQPSTSIRSIVSSAGGGAVLTVSPRAGSGGRSCNLR